MSENFIRLKRRALAVALVKSALVALSCGALCSGVLLLLTTHGIINTDPLLPTLIGGIGALIVSGAVAFLVLKRNDASLAHLLDREFDLHERVDTMLQYKDAENTMSALQREDTESALSAIKSSDIKFKRLWIYVIALALGVATLVCAVLLIPPKAPVKPKPETPFKITQLQVRAMEELMVQIADSEMQSPYREQAEEAVSDALAQLKLATTESERDEVLERAVQSILTATDDSSSALEIINALAKSDSRQVRLLADAINHYTYKRGSEWDSFDQRMTALRDSFVHANAGKDSADKSAMATETRALLSQTAIAIKAGLNRSQVSDTDELYTVLLRFAEQSGDEGVHGLASLYVASENMSYDEIQMHLDNTFNTMKVEIYKALEVKSENVSTGEYAVTRICELFGYTLPKFERPDAIDENTGTGDGAEGDQGSSGGAIGSGTEYGSDELVFDPMTGEYVEYGEIIDRYYQIMFNKIQGDFYTEDEKEALKKYFEILYGGFDEEK